MTIDTTVDCSHVRKGRRPCSGTPYTVDPRTLIRVCLEAQKDTLMSGPNIARYRSSVSYGSRPGPFPVTYKIVPGNEQHRAQLNKFNVRVSQVV